MVTRCTSWAYVAAVFLLTVVSTATAKYSGGTGEPNDPYQIATAADLIALGETPADYDKHFILTADLDLDPNLPGRKVFDKAVIAPDVNDMNSWFDGTPFTGVFDGNGHTISNLTITGKKYLGLFGGLNTWWDTPGAEVKDLGVVDVNITGSGGYVGGLVGSNGDWRMLGGSVRNCYSTGMVSGKDSVGGLMGYNDGTIAASYSSASTVGVWYVGGLVGSNGRPFDPGHGEGSMVTCVSTGMVNGNSEVGGLVGQNVGTVTQCYSTSKVTGDGNDVGGLVGINAGFVTQCYSTGTVEGNDHVGGLVGYDDKGGLSWPPGDVIKSFWDTQTSGQSTSAGGTGETTAELRKASTFRGWGTCGNEGVWTIAEGNDYPRLWWENQPGEPIRVPILSDLLLGTGTEDDPFLIYTAEQLNTIGLFPCEWNKYFKLMEDIDLSGFDGKEGRPPFNMIAPGVLNGLGYFLGTPFTGVFDGNSHTISHLTVMVNDGGCAGLIGGLESGAKIKDLGVIDVNVTGSGGGVGGLAGVLGGYSAGVAVTHCYSTGIVRGDYFVGGLAGINRGIVTQCQSTGAVIAGVWSVGGLVGTNGGAITQCYSTGTVDGDEDVGGLVGLNGASQIDGWTGEVTDCYSTAAVRGTGEWGGVGGLVGCNDFGSITTSYSTGTVAGNKDVGGLVGHQSYHYSNITGCFWDTQTSGQTTSARSTGKTTAEMQTARTFLEAGWDFVGEMPNGTEDIWWILEGKDYPHLWWEAVKKQKGTADKR